MVLLSKLETGAPCRQAHGSEANGVGKERVPSLWQVQPCVGP